MTENMPFSVATECVVGFPNTRTNGSYVLIGRQGAECGNINYAHGKFWASEHAVVATPDRDLEYRWLGETLRAMNLNQYSEAAAQPGLSVEVIGRLKVPFPPVPEQQQIAAFLGWKTGQIDALIARKKELLDKLKEKRLAVTTQAVTRGLNPAAPLRDSGIPWLGNVPKHWEVIPLGFLVTLSGGLTPSMANSEYWGGDVPWVTPKDMKQARISDSIDHVTEKALDETGLALIPSNAILVVVRGMILAHSFPTALTEQPVTINQDMKALRAGEKLEVDYLFWCLTGFGKVFSALAQESAHGTRRMETETIKKFAFPVPPRGEQRAIVCRLDEEMKQLDDLSLATENTIARLTEYRTALITAATTGKIDVRAVKIPDEDA
ncbi:MAG TPA: restriction endonuclease subunit S [Bryobacteraceae bacterium]|nr:restriction endonuclease subunit S [Bryobacteraceae bacterium]